MLFDAEIRFKEALFNMKKENRGGGKNKNTTFQSRITF